MAPSPTLFTNRMTPNTSLPDGWGGSLSATGCGRKIGMINNEWGRSSIGISSAQQISSAPAPYALSCFSNLESDGS